MKHDKALSQGNLYAEFHRVAGKAFDDAQRTNKKQGQTDKSSNYFLKIVLTEHP